MEISIRHNGVAPEKVVATSEMSTNGGKGMRGVELSGWGKSEIAARQQLLEQAKAMRNELNLAIEGMIEELCAGIARA